jgi:hypothetical protein
VSDDEIEIILADTDEMDQISRTGAHAADLCRCKTKLSRHDQRSLLAKVDGLIMTC